MRLIQSQTVYSHGGVFRRFVYLVAFSITFLFFFILRRTFLYSGKYELNCFHLGMPLYLNILLGLVLTSLFGVILLRDVQESGSRGMVVGYLLVLTGSLFNLAEKAGTGCVVDYIDVTSFVLFPKFNLPDLAISVGVLTLALGICISKLKLRQSV